MAIFSYIVGERISRGRGQSAVKAAAYQKRDCLVDQRTGHTYNYLPKEHSAIAEAAAYIERSHGYDEGRKAALFVGLYAPREAPEWCRGAENVETFWNRLEVFEKRLDAQLAERIIIALPHELTLQQNIWLLQDHVKEFTRQGRVVQVAIHAPEHGDRPGAEKNVHAHLLISMRGVDEHGFKATKAETQSRYLHRREYVTELRQKWADVTNHHLGRHGIEARIDHRTLEAQGIDRAPTIHLGPGDSRRERHGIESAAGAVNREIAAVNAQRARPSLDRAHDARHVEREAEVVDLDAWRRGLEQDATAQPPAQEAAQAREIAPAPEAPAPAKEATDARESGRAAHEDLDIEIRAIDAWRLGLEKEWAEQSSPIKPAERDLAWEAENERLERVAWSDRKPGSRDPLETEDLAQKLSPAYAEATAAIAQERGAIEKAGKIRDAAEQHGEVAAYRQEERRQVMGVWRRLAHKVGLWTDTELSKWELADTFAEKGAERWSTRGRTAEDRLAYFERQAAAEFDKVKPAAERELAQRRDRAENARAQLAARGAWITDPPLVTDPVERQRLGAWQAFHLGKMRAAEMERDAQRQEQKQAQASGSKQSAPAAPWMTATGGLNALSPAHRRSAEKSYAAWSEAKPELAKRHDLADYVSYVQDQWAKDEHRPGHARRQAAVQTPAQRQARAAAFWQRSIDAGRALREAEEGREKEEQRQKQRQRPVLRL
jgi:MobA/MobL family